MPYSQKSFQTREEQFRHLRQENDVLIEQVMRLTEEVKRLTRTESKLYQMQKRLDRQIYSYQSINEFCKKLNQAIALSDVFDAIKEFILYEVNLERCLIFLRDRQEDIFPVQALDGYYDEEASQQFENLKLMKSDLHLETLLSKAEYVICSEQCEETLICHFRDLFGMQEYVLFAIGEDKREPIGLLVAGNTQEMANYQTRVTADGDFLLYLSNLAYQVSTAIKKTLFYEELQKQKEDLKKAILELNLKKTRLEVTLQDLDEARSMANHDSLTGLFNRTYFNAQLPQEFNQAKLGGYPISVVLMDIDFFKSINDNFGHPVGDLVLKKVGEILKQHTETDGIAFRYGGEEFVLVFSGVAPEVAYDRAESIRQCFQDQSFRVNRHDVSTTLSAGIAYGPVGYDRYEKLVSQADEALYRAKSLGRNRIETFVI
ncbi:sensor domain-containing diguanylate cyclase [Oscillatoria sp. CS-180]|uniref:GGDEF domain-containing protein n=1 Tax=Oscillatoria sp. CS-180 TaxID=3021720 RepID=UPI00232B2938|nr:sensor domain-containing diguanylate cyclase [Oscillatoria sp. CS-180]MDB9528832.1 sensor domain-containing diguanylate cyclase [Oscillatoria sp. CS-180]